VTGKVPLPVKILWLSILPIVHVCFCLHVIHQHYEGGWNDLPIIVVDLPFFVCLLPLIHYLHFPINETLLVIYGTLWWYFVSWILMIFFRKIRPWIAKYYTD